MAHVLVIDDSWEGEITPGALVGHREVLALCWLAPESTARLAAQGVRCHDLLTIVGGLGRWEREAMALVESVCDAGEYYDGHPWRALVAEELLREAFAVQLAHDAVAYGQRLGVEGWTLHLGPELRGYFQALGIAGNVATTAAEPTIPNSGFIPKLMRRARRGLG